MKEHLPWIVPVVIAVLGALWIVERSMIENGPVRVAVLEHKVEILEAAILNKGANDEKWKEVDLNHSNITIRISRLWRFERRNGGLLQRAESEQRGFDQVDRIPVEGEPGRADFTIFKLSDRHEQGGNDTRSDG